MFQAKVVEKMKTHILRSIIFFEIRAIYKICEKMLYSRTGLMKMCCMHIACCMPKATNTHWQYVIIIASPLQQSPHKRAFIVTLYVHSCQQKHIGLKFSKSQTGSDVRYSCHHNWSRFTFPIFAHSCRFSVLHSLQSITPRIY